MDTDMDDVQVEATGLGPEGTRSFQHHTLRIAYPAVDLVPNSKEVFLQTPRRVSDREKPATGLVGLSKSDLTYFVRYETDHALRDCTAIRNSEPTLLEPPQRPLSLLDCIDRLAIFPGVSALRAVSWVDEHEVYTRFQVKTTYYTDSGKVKERDMEWVMGSTERNEMFWVLGKREWVRLLLDLFYAKTDRAWRHVVERMNKSYKHDWLEDEMASWGFNWDEYGPRDPKRLFMNRLVELCGSGVEIPWIEVAEAEYLRDQDAIRVRFPCGHEHTIPENGICEMGQLAAWEARCPVCRRRVLTPEDEIALLYFFDRLERNEWYKKMKEWLPKCKRVRNHSTAVELSGAALSASIERALTTFKSPELLNPPCFDPATYPESQALLNLLKEKLMSNPTRPQLTPKKLFDALEKLANDLLTEMVGGDEAMKQVVLPPGYNSIITRWMTRAVNDAVGSLADDEHDDELNDAIARMEKSKIDPLESQTVRDLDNILATLGRVKLEDRGDEQVGDGDEER